MSNINAKEHLFVMVKGKDGGLERREVKRRQVDYKLYDRLHEKFKTEVRKTKRLT